MSDTQSAAAASTTPVTPAAGRTPFVAELNSAAALQGVSKMRDAGDRPARADAGT